MMALRYCRYGAKPPIGVWKTIDDNTGEAKSHVEILRKAVSSTERSLNRNHPDKICEEMPIPEKGLGPGHAGHREPGAL